MQIVTLQAVDSIFYVWHIFNENRIKDVQCYKFINAIYLLTETISTHDEFITFYNGL